MAQKDHPRLCGEKVHTWTKRSQFTGSPPPMRGKGRFCFAVVYQRRITPAYAGKSEYDILLHPHSLGSPPPMRGKVDNVSTILAAVRITPAYAGKSTKKCCCSCVSEDHPRLCGEKQFKFHLLYLQKGSPPPMRGKEIADVHDGKDGGITPAYAGKSCYRGRKDLCYEDHPRLCGEKIPQQYETGSKWGSPPPMRGKGPFCGGSLFEVGITPAYAGKSNSVAAASDREQDHPRLCGEKASSAALKTRNGGITPAYAGKRPE